MCNLIDCPLPTRAWPRQAVCVNLFAHNLFVHSPPGRGHGRQCVLLRALAPHNGLLLRRGGVPGECVKYAIVQYYIVGPTPFFTLCLPDRVRMLRKGPVMVRIAGELLRGQ